MSKEVDHREREKTPKPPTLTPPDAELKKTEVSSRVVPMVIAGVGGLLVILALLVLVLPIKEHDFLTLQVMPAKELPATPPQAAQQQSSYDNQAAQKIEQLIGVWLRKQAEAEGQNIIAWGGETYRSAAEKALDCERLLKGQKYLDAKHACEEAIAGLGRLLAGKNSLLERALAEGTQALIRGEANSAADHFSTAIAIAPGNEFAATGIKRAAKLPQVLSFIDDGLSLEDAGDPEGALLAFKEAVTLDPLYQPAQVARKRVEEFLSDRTFQQAMSQALQAFAAGRQTEAGKLLHRARAIRPGDPAVVDLETQLAQNRLTQKLERLRREAKKFQEAERWSDALKSCQQALALDEHAAFAATCRDQARFRIDLDNQLQSFLNRPERMFDDGPLGEARQLLAFARSVDPRGVHLSAQIASFAAKIREAETEVAVVIKSDGLSEITIYHVGRLGSFQEKRLVLRTGNYTVTASRSGFRDKRRILQVRPEQGTQEFTLFCEEPI